jgi:Ca-activated chloride channel homolog
MPLRVVLVLLFAAVLAWGSWRVPGFWITPDRHGDRLLAAGDYESAADTYRDPWRIGTAQYRNGDFKKAAATFARVPGAIGAFDQGNAELMHGAYDAAVKSFDRALGFRPGWTEARENKALAIARRQRLEDAGANREQESTGAYEPDETVVDSGGEDRDPPSEPEAINGNALSDSELRATWLRRVQTTPGDFLRAKFAYQAARADAAAPPDTPQTSP